MLSSQALSTFLLNNCCEFKQKLGGNSPDAIHFLLAFSGRPILVCIKAAVFLRRFDEHRAMSRSVCNCARFTADIRAHSQWLIKFMDYVTYVYVADVVSTARVRHSSAVGRYYGDACDACPTCAGNRNRVHSHLPERDDASDYSHRV